MKHRILSLAVLLMLSIASFAQFPRIKFKGIPVDGFKKDMVQSLQNKGFDIVDSQDGILTGQFNGHDVNLAIVTNNNKVCRIMVCDKNLIDETEIKIRFNTLCHQFANNRRYVSYEDGDQTIPENVDISYEMNVNNKRFQAVFYQRIDTTEVQIVRKDQGTDEDCKNKEIDELNDEVIIETENIRINTGNTIQSLQVMMPVWFCIMELYGRYYISMYYDNEYNRANGEDL